MSSFVETKGKPYVIICTNCGSGKAIDADSEPDAAGGVSRVVPRIPKDWQRIDNFHYPCPDCTSAQRAALEQRRSSAAKAKVFGW